ncbi:MAG TPA: histidine kinase [Blastocatellia bacterium]|jgi:signal transduction histidine kinase|nr:histidine kinase [Blastocatellia bacterium]
MTAAAAAALLNMLGYITGLSLYTMLLVMLLRGPRAASSIGTEGRADVDRTDRLPLLTALLGLAWNLGALLGLGIHNFGGWRWSSLLGAAAFSALGFLPAVVVHSVLRSSDAWRRPMTMGMLIAAYSFSVAASAFHLYQAFVRQTTPSHWALHILTAGFSALIIALLAATRGRPGWGGAGWVVVLAIFAVSAVHLSHHEGREYPWWVELAGHHASLPLALVILYQDYRFALADIFLKRALSLVLLVGLAFGLYLNVAAPTLERRNGQPVAIGLLLGLWVVTALAYPWLRSGANWFVDVVVLRRTDYEALRAEIAQSIALLEAPEQVLDETCARLAEALTAREVTWRAVNDSSGEECEAPSAAPLLPQLLLPPNPSKGAKAARASRRLIEPDARATTILMPTAEPPQYRLTIGEMAGGRRLMSDDVAFLEAVAVMVARRIDAARVTHERCARDLREQEATKLATEAELRALRAQVNPHFLFNSLTTIGYLIQTAPERAFETLMRLTALLRGVLRRSEGEFATLGEEIELIESYLDIERARFEDRLRVTIDAPRETRNHRIPALLIQPLVENAIKHGVSPSRTGGEVVISARIAMGASAPPGGDTLRISVRDTGLGASEESLIAGRNRGVGLSNVKRRLEAHYGDQASFNIRSAPGAGTVVELALPINLTRATTGAPSGAN